MSLLASLPSAGGGVASSCRTDQGLPSPKLVSKVIRRVVRELVQVLMTFLMRRVTTLLISSRTTFLTTSVAGDATLSVVRRTGQTCSVPGARAGGRDRGARSGLHHDE